MTSTSTFKGMDSETKPSSRVLAPPGGGSSNIFGSSEPAQPPPKKEVAPPPKPAEPTPVSQSTQGERFVRAAPKQAYNPITGQPYDMPEEKKKEPAVAKNEDEEEKAMGKENEQKPDTKTQPPVAAKEKTSTRIAQPPGGKSSGLW